MGTKKTQFAADEDTTARFTVVGAAPGRKRVYLHNQTTKTLFVSLGSDGEDGADLPTVDDEPDLTFSSFPVVSGGVWWTDPGPAEDEIVAFFEDEDATEGNFLRVTETF